MKYTIEKINEELEGTGWTCQSDTYKNLDTILTFQCANGHLVQDTWKHIRLKQKCPICEQNIYNKNDNSIKIIPKKSNKIRVIGLDQATKISGYSVFDGKELIDYGVFSAPEDKKEIERDNIIRQWLINLITNFKPDIVVLEGIQYQKMIGVETLITLARLQGVLLITAYDMGADPRIAHTATWRNYNGVKGKTRSDRKKSAQLIVKELYDIKVSEDVADAILIGRYGTSLGAKREIKDWM